ncbi:cuticlin-like protein 19 [Ditylenchus destructor]|nr:cuticlin-like protein 19 [Ditylenchus destructor]
MFGGFSDEINKNINVVIDPVRILMDEGQNISMPQNSTQRKTFTFGRSRSNVVDASNLPICVMTIHRDDCSKPRISDHTTYVMRVQSCWIGSIGNPIFVIKSDGCTNEETMITTPRYDSLFHSATAAGWLAVRVVGLNYTRLSCAIRLCNICESPEYCLSITPPQCKKVVQQSPDIWNQTTILDEICRDNSTTTTSSSFKAHCSPYLCLLWINFMWIAFVIIRPKT